MVRESLPLGQEKVLTYLGCVVGRAKDQLWRSIVSRTDVGYVRLVFNQDLGTSEVAKLEYPCIWVKQEVLWLDITVADALRMNVGQSSEELIDI